MIAARDETQVREAIEAMARPSYVDRIILEFGNDWAGDPAVFVYVILRDEAVENDQQFKTVTEEMATMIRDAVRETDSDRWPFLNFRTTSEQEEVDLITVSRQRSR